MLETTIDTTGLEAHERAFFARLDGMWREFAKLVAETVRRFIVEQMIDAPVPAGQFSSDNKLHILTGQYARSFSPGQPFNLYTVDLATGTVTIGSTAPESFHETGGRIRATPAMVRFFWAKFIETQLPKWKIIALAAKHRGYLLMKARPTVEPAEREYISRGLDALALELTDQIIGEWNASAQ